VVTALEHGIRTVDSSVGGLGGCPYSPGATGNVATEDVIYALKGSQYEIAGGVDLDQVVDIGWWISDALGRECESRVGRAVRARKKHDARQLEGAGGTAKSKL
jgi:hydroxymethylglutaryl-CoA lyase